MEPKEKRTQFFAQEGAEPAGRSDADPALRGCERPKLRAHSPGTVKGQPRAPASPPQSRRIAHARRRPDSAPPRVGTYSGRGGGGGLRAVAGGLDACPSAGIWDRAAPRRPGEWWCGAVGTWVGRGRVWLHDSACAPPG